MSREIPLTRGKVAFVDDEVYEAISSVKWQATQNGKKWYAVRWDKRKRVYMHRVILGYTGNGRVDHRDGDGLNNTRGNLRVCTHTQNLHNSGPTKTNKSGYKGVSWSKKRKKWIAQIMSERKHHLIGVFDDPVDAAHAYDAMAILLHGKFAWTNFPKQGEN